MFVIITFILNNNLMAVQECILFSYFYDVNLRNSIVHYRPTKCLFVELNLFSQSLPHVHVLNPRANLQEDSCNK